MVVKMVTYKEFKKLVCLRCLDGPFSMFSKERKLKAVNETITENENVIKERYEGLFGAFGDYYALKDLLIRNFCILNSH